MSEPDKLCRDCGFPHTERGDVCADCKTEARTERIAGNRASEASARLELIKTAQPRPAEPKAERPVKTERVRAAKKPIVARYTHDPEEGTPMPRAKNGSVQIYGAGYLPPPAAKVRAERILLAVAEWEAELERYEAER